jgi:hypothetical protein
LSRRCGSLDLSYPYGPSLPDRGIVFFSFRPTIRGVGQIELVQGSENLTKLCLERAFVRYMNKQEGNITVYPANTGVMM